MAHIVLRSERTQSAPAEPHFSLHKIGRVIHVNDLVKAWSWAFLAVNSELPRRRSSKTNKLTRSLIARLDRLHRYEPTIRAASTSLVLLFSARSAFAFPTSSASHQDELRGNSVVDAPFLHPTAVIPRFLQSSGGNASADGGGTADPDVVCESLNEQLKGEMTCTCARYGRRGVSVSCNAVVDTCNEDNTYCVRLSTQYYTDEKGVPIVMTSCTNLTTPGIVDKVDSCVQLFPAEAGNFTTVTKCYATLNDQICGCSVCDASGTVAVAAADRATGNGTGGGGAGVSVDCCRIMDGAKATCLPVLSSGPVAVQYDQVSDEQQCKATSDGGRSRSQSLATAAIVLLMAGTNIFHSTISMW